MAMEKYFIVNVGSESRKYALYQNGERAFSAHFEKKEGTAQEFENSAEYVINELLSQKLVNDKNEISAIGFRVVAPGSYFLQNKIIDGEYLEKLEAAKERAPLHINPMLAELKALGQILPGVPIVGVSDSAFHGSMPARSRLYAIPKNTAEELDIFRFGYHGISFESIVGKLKNISDGHLPPKGAPLVPEKIIICHLGGGSSVAAVKDGKSIDTSMGFTPLEGIVMASRVGDIDAGAVTYLSKKLGYGPDEMNDYLNTQCGLLGLSGKSNDVRELLEMEKNGDENAKLALEVMVYKIKKYIGAYFAALNGADVLVFSATIGERSAIMRARICAELENLGIVLDAEKNNKTISIDGFISEDTSPVKIAVITTDEMSQIAAEVAAKMNW
ncbi:MAG: acetate/propionate family kinase [Candidatus Azambacteria bacterium]|nr:acetate/propionate family kinase [Candidatus Azambacteria bacterium]